MILYENDIQPIAIINGDDYRLYMAAHEAKDKGCKTFPFASAEDESIAIYSVEEVMEALCDKYEYQ